MASRHELRARHTEEKQRQNPQQRFKRNMAIAALVGVTAAAAIGVFAGTYYLEDGDILVEGYEDGTYVTQNDITVRDDEEIIIRQNEEQDNSTATSNTLTIVSNNDEHPDEEKYNSADTAAGVETEQETGEESKTTVEVKIDNINIGVSNKAAISIKGEGDVVLELDGDNVVKSVRSHAGVEKNDSDGKGTLTIQDKDNDGSLTAEGSAAGIGSRNSESTSNIVIDGGIISATGHSASAGIGSGSGGNAENIIINGGTVEAKGAGGGAGIGGGNDGDATIAINGGIVNAKGSTGSGAGIGGGLRGNAEVTITGGTVNAVGGNSGGSGIGSGGAASGSASLTDARGTVTITGGTITAKAGRKYDDQPQTSRPADDIGNGRNTIDEPTVTWTGGTVITESYIIPENHVHSWGSPCIVREATDTEEGEQYSECSCGSVKWEKTPIRVDDQNSPLTVTTLLSTVQPYEKTLADGRAVFAAPAQDAILTGSLGALAELKAQGAQTLVFRTQQCETSMSIDKILAAGSEDDVFALTHKGAEAVLTVEGRVIK